MEGLAVGLGFVSFGFSAVGAFGVGADLLFSGDVALSAGDLGAIFGAASGSVDAGSCAAGVSVSCGLGVAAAGLGLAGVGLSLTATSAAAEAADASANAARLERAFTAAKFNLIPAAGEGVDPAALFASNAAGNAWGPAAVAAFNSSTRSLSLDAQLQGLSGIAALGGVAFVTPDIFNLAGRK